MTTPNGREALIKELNNIIPCSCIAAYKLRELCAPDCANCNYVEEVADFILSREKKIVSPLVEYRDKCKADWGTSDVDPVIDQTLSNAGVTL
ncbi:MAG TPA: hypothetical protein VII94_05825 [Candidatus Saccharimonadales bacterium]